MPSPDTCPHRHSDNTPRRQSNCDQTVWTCITPFSNQARCRPAVEILVACQKQYLGRTARAAQVSSSRENNEKLSCNALARVVTTVLLPS